MRLFVLTGAGISAESGVPVFQGTSWRGYSHYQLASIDAWRADPRLVWEYYSERRQRARDSRPNPAHIALAQFAESGEIFLCTQNVDHLHEDAGSRDVVHIHGRLFESRCDAACGRPAFADRETYSPDSLPHCDCGALVRPNVCWFGEQPYHLDRIFRELERCDCFLSIGTSGSVEPAASFAGYMKRAKPGARIVCVGIERPANAVYFDEVQLGPASTLVPEILGEITKKRMV